MGTFRNVFGWIFTSTSTHLYGRSSSTPHPRANLRSWADAPSKPAGLGSDLAFQGRRSSTGGEPEKGRRIISDSFSATSSHSADPKYGYWRRIVSKWAQWPRTCLAANTTRRPWPSCKNLEVEHARNRLTARWDGYPPTGPSKLMTGKGAPSWDDHDEFVDGWKGHGAKRKTQHRSLPSLSSLMSRSSLQSDTDDRGGYPRSHKGNRRTKQSMLDGDSRYPIFKAGLHWARHEVLGRSS
ncbi:hypothetical protein BKA70DRAFT_1222406 [Coprinopsis sp. MPI-PUGE-AT-0042]|nr:hypothetical protein BKA70DRAFT_1222406 [Coprinopsis sp. MPI-PUGE-AT-0042]